ncbi:MAG: LamG domain-containing protein [bacterium]|nr:LamG domain-containing protein [bacterium]
MTDSSLWLTTFLAVGLAQGVSAQITNQDDCSNAGMDQLVGNGQWTYDTGSATTGTQGQNEAGCLSFGTRMLDFDIWFTWTAQSDGVARIETCNANGTHADSKIAVWPASPSCPTDGTSITCNDDSCGLLSSVTFPVSSGSSYIVQLGSFPGATGGDGVVDIATAQPGTGDLVAHYRLDETSGTVCADSSGNGNDGTYVGGVTLGAAGADPGTMTSVEFDGVSGRVEIPGSPMLDALRSDFSVSAWVNVNQVSSIQRIFGNLGGGGGWSYAIAAFGVQFSTHGIDDFNFGVPVNPNSWYQIGVTFDVFNTVRFYFDGNLVATQQGDARADPPGPTYVIGTFDNMIEFLNGRIDDIQVYDGVLSDAGMAFLFNNPGEVFVPGGPIGTTYCSPAVANSTGQFGVITAFGSAVVNFNDVALTADQLPPNQFGFFLVGRTQGSFIPPGSSGFICMTGDIGRYNAITEIFQGPTGALAIDLTDIPTNTPGSQMVMPGETINFQAWYRDILTTNNFTDAVSIDFQ